MELQTTVEQDKKERGKKMSEQELDKEHLKEALLADYKNKKPNPFIQFDVSCDPQCFDVPGEDGYSLLALVTYELMDGSDVRILVDPETPKDKAIESLKRVAEWIKKSDILERKIEELVTNREKQKAFEIENKLKEIGYTKDEISLFCRNYSADNIVPF